MHALRTRLAFVLLLCFARVLLPDAWVLALHAHEHTTEEPTSRISWPKGKALLSAKHQHCDADQFFKSAFEPAPAPLALVQSTGKFALTTIPAFITAWYLAPLVTADLRGPPSQS